MIRCQAKGIRMKAIWLSLFHLFTFSPLTAQTVSSVYQPGVTTEGAVYFLPKTAVSVTVQVEKTTYTPGDFCQYAERFLRIKEVSPTPSVGYRIIAIRQDAVAVPDTAKRYAVKFDAKTSATNVRLSDDGILMAINTEDRDYSNNKSLQRGYSPSSVLLPPSSNQYKRFPGYPGRPGR